MFVRQKRIFRIGDIALLSADGGDAMRFHGMLVVLYVAGYDMDKPGPTFFHFSTRFHALFRRPFFVHRFRNIDGGFFFGFFFGLFYNFLGLFESDFDIGLAFQSLLNDLHDKYAVP